MNPIFKFWLISLFVTLSTSNIVFAENSFRFGVINERPERPDYALKQFGQLQAYLKKKLAAQDIVLDSLVVARNIEEMIQLVDKGKVDALFEGVLPSLLIKQNTRKLEPSMVVWRRGQRQYHSVFFVPKESPIKKLDDLKGKTIAFESPRSTSAYFIPLYTLQAEGLTLASLEQPVTDKDTMRFLFAGSELNQAYWVYKGKADVAAFNNGDWDLLPDKIKQHLRIIHSTKPLLRWLFSFSKRLDKNIRKKVIDIMKEVHLNPTGKQALQTASNIAQIELLNEQDKQNLVYWDEVTKNIK